MVGGAGSVTLSLSLLGHPVQAQPWSRMARSHLRRAAVPRETWLVRSSSSPDGGEGRRFLFLIHSWRRLGNVRDVQRGLVWWHGLHGIVQASPLQAKNRDPCGIQVLLWVGRSIPRKEDVCPPASISLGSRKEKISCYVCLIPDNVPIPPFIPRKQGIPFVRSDPTSLELWPHRNIPCVVGDYSMF